MLIIFHSTKRFSRWERGSCVESKPVQVPGQDEPYVFSFFTDVSRHPSVLELAQGIQETVRASIGELARLANWWKKYRSLWKLQRVSGRVWYQLNFVIVMSIAAVKLCLNSDVCIPVFHTGLLLIVEVFCCSPSLSYLCEVVGTSTVHV